MNHKLVRLWAAGEVLTSTSPADRHALKKLVEDYDKVTSNLRSEFDKMILTLQGNVEYITQVGDNVDSHKILRGQITILKYMREVLTKE